MNNKRPPLNPKIDPEEFKNFYWLKEELTAFCKKHSLPTGGSKTILTDRIYYFLKTGETPKPPEKKSAGNSKKKSSTGEKLSLSAKIPADYKNDERHREFFKSVIGPHFKFNVLFMNWLKANSGKTYQAAVNEWNRLYEEKKAGKKYEISAQFEYNQYTRDFFKANPGRTRKDAIACWKYKKSLPGSNKYEKKDLKALK